MKDNAYQVQRQQENFSYSQVPNKRGVLINRGWNKFRNVINGVSKETKGVGI